MDLIVVQYLVNVFHVEQFEKGAGEGKEAVFL